jgi:hypothetical protein
MTRQCCSLPFTRQLQFARNAKLSVIPRGVRPTSSWSLPTNLELVNNANASSKAARRRQTRRIIRGNKLQVYLVCPSPVCKVEKRT